jgi:hypothetical protein
MTTQAIVLYVVGGMLFLLYILRRRSRLNSDE